MSVWQLLALIPFAIGMVSIYWLADCQNCPIKAARNGMIYGWLAALFILVVLK